jgi:cell shape-determining protein MreC
MAEYTHTLSTTADLKKLNLQNMQLSIRIAELEKENKALKDKLAQIIIKDNKPCN